MQAPPNSFFEPAQQASGQRRRDRRWTIGTARDNSPPIFRSIAVSDGGVKGSNPPIFRRAAVTCEGTQVRGTNGHNLWRVVVLLFYYYYKRPLQNFVWGERPYYYY